MTVFQGPGPLLFFADTPPTEDAAGFVERYHRFLLALCSSIPESTSIQRRVSVNRPRLLFFCRNGGALSILTG
jgi:hypothetical protein